MFVIKFSQATVEKFVVVVESNGWGNGVGKTGVVHGTFVLFALTVCVGAAVADDANESDEPVGVVFGTVVAGDEAG